MFRRRNFNWSFVRWPRQTEIESVEQSEGENTSHDQAVEVGWSKKEQPSGRSRNEETKINWWWYWQQYLDSLKELDKLMGETSSDSDRMFLLSLLHATKQFSPFHNRVEVQETLRRKLRCSAASEFQLITYQNTSSASPSALSDYSNNSRISLVDYISTSQACPRNATDPATCYVGWAVRSAPSGSSIHPAVEGSSVHHNSSYELPIVSQ